jgi:hypothetical protein
MKLELVSLCLVSFLASLGRSSRVSSDTESNVAQPPSDNVPESSESYFPWTYKPACTEYLDDIGSKLCVYTNATFSNDRGISIFTTPQIAEKFASLPPFQDPTALASNGINANANRAKQAWHTDTVPGKGMGMFASRPLQRGDQITAYTPYLLAHMENILSTTEREHFLGLAVDQLPPASREAYLALAKIYNVPSVVVQDVVKANAFEIQVGGEMHLAVFPESSRFNHACAPKYASPSPYLYLPLTY